MGALDKGDRDVERKIRNRVSEILEKTSPKELLDMDIQGSQLMYSIFGFIPATDCTDNVILLSNLGYVLGQKGYNVCLVDFKVFQPNLYLYLDMPHNPKGKGLITLLKDDKADLREEISKTKYDGLYLLSPSPQDLMEEYFDYEMEQVSFVIEILKKSFDIVLIDIPNVPPLEFCLGAMKHCHVGFFTATERIDALSGVTRLLDFAGSLGIGVNKFANMIFTNMQYVKFDYASLEKLHLRIVAGLPMVKGAITDALDGKLYMKDNPFVSSAFKKELGKIVSDILDQE